MSQIVVDTSAVIAAVLNEPEKDKIVEFTEGAELVAPSSLHWEVGNALSAMFKRGRLKLKEALKAVKEYEKVPIQFADIEVSDALKVSDKESVYAYDAYFIVCAKKYKSPMLTLDKSLGEVAARNGIRVLEV